MERKMKGGVVLINRKGKNRAAGVGVVRPWEELGSAMGDGGRH
jgi:hypothetical protein